MRNNVGASSRLVASLGVIVGGIGFAGVVGVAGVAQAQLQFKAVQTGGQEVPPNGSTATGDFNILLTGNPGAYQISFAGGYTGLGSSYSASHLHQGAVGANGPVVLNLAPHHIPFNPTKGSWDGRLVPVADTLANALIAGTIYVNTHSSGLPGGEIRGQLLPVAGTALHAAMTGGQVVPPNNSPATGLFNVVLSGSPGAFQIAFSGSYQGLLSFFAGGRLENAPPGSNGPVVLNPGGHLFNGTGAGSYLLFGQSVSDFVANQLLAGQIYFVIDSGLTFGPEIRGQLVIPCYADCDGSGNLTIDDFICFQTLFALGDPGADCDASGSLTIDDFICFQTFFAIGC